MANGYSRSPKLLKGALIQFSAPMLIPIPNIILFQYNPETMSRSLTPWAPPEESKDKEKSAAPPPKTEDSQAQPYDPKETINLAIELDATDALETPSSHPVAKLVGIADRISALELLMYPPGESALGGLLNVSVSVSISAGGISASVGAAAEVVPRKTVPVALFFWGPGRIVPVRIISFSVDEQAYSPILYPLRAKCSLSLRVLDASAFGDDDSAEVKIAKACYTFTRAQKEALALANVANTAESIMGMLPI